MATEQEMQDAHAKVWRGRDHGGAGSMTRHAFPPLALVMAALAVLVQGCREEEQDRPLAYQKGSYQGQVDQQLDQEQVEALRQRTSQQQM